MTVVASNVESYVVGAILSKSDFADQALTLLTPLDFSDSWYRAAFESALASHELGRNISHGVVAQGLQERGHGTYKGNLERLFDLGTEALCSLMQPEYAIGFLRDHARLRKVRERISAIADPGDLDDVLIDALSGARAEVVCKRIGQVLSEVAARQDAIQTGDLTIGYPWGIAELDEHVNIRMGSLSCVAALKGAAKSALVLHTLRVNAMNLEPIPGLVFSLEMDSDRVGIRYVAAETEINSRLFDSPFMGQRDLEALREAVRKNESTPLWIDDTPSMSAQKIIAKAKLWKRRHGIDAGLVAIDFAQLVDSRRGRNETTAEALKNAAYAFLDLARSEKLAVILVAQFRNEAEREPEPRLQDIEGSGGIAQACDVVLGLHLPSRTDRRLAQREGDTRTLQIHVLKNRHGASGQVIDCKAQLALNRFHGATAGVLAV